MRMNTRNEMTSVPAMCFNFIELSRIGAWLQAHDSKLYPKPKLALMLHFVRWVSWSLGEASAALHVVPMVRLIVLARSLPHTAATARVQRSEMQGCSVLALTRFASCFMALCVVLFVVLWWKKKKVQRLLLLLPKKFDYVQLEQRWRAHQPCASTSSNPVIWADQRGWCIQKESCCHWK